MTFLIETKRLIIKAPTLADYTNIHMLNTDKDVMHFIGQGALNTPGQTEEKLARDIAHIAKHQFGFGSVFEKNSGEFVGQAGLFHLEYNDQQPQDQPVNIEVGYRLAKKYWNQGFATELVRGISHWGFNHLPIEKLLAVIDPRNIMSQKVILKAGFDFVDTIHCYNKQIKLYQLNKVTFPS